MHNNFMYDLINQINFDRDIRTVKITMSTDFLLE